jgi:hypothetical protein
MQFRCTPRGYFVYHFRLISRSLWNRFFPKCMSWIQLRKWTVSWRRRRFGSPCFLYFLSFFVLRLFFIRFCVFLHSFRSYFLYLRIFISVSLFPCQLTRTQCWFSITILDNQLEAAVLQHCNLEALSAFGTIKWAVAHRRSVPYSAVFLWTAYDVEWKMAKYISPETISIFLFSPAVYSVGNTDFSDLWCVISTGVPDFVVLGREAVLRKLEGRDHLRYLNVDRLEDNIMMGPKEIGCEALYWINLVKNRVQWRDLVIAVMKLWDLYKAGILLEIRANFSFLRRTVLHGIS